MRSGVALALLLVATPATAACPRPDADAASAGQRVQVHYVAADVDAASADAVRDVADHALESYAEWGYPLPPADCDGDPRYDVYLVRFEAGDGQTVPERCGAAGCSSYARVAYDLDARYGSVLVGAQTVVAHELFHGVQYAITPELPPFFAEGTAQYAAERLQPSLQDLESNLPTFFATPERPLDAQGAAAVGSWQYATAIWPTFLAARFGDDLVRDVLLATHEAAAFDAMDAVLSTHESGLGQAFADFGVWNAATGDRYDPAGYPNGKSYPEVPLTSGEPSGVLTSLSTRYYALDADAPKHLELEADAVIATVLPVGNLAGARTLPADVPAGAYILIASSTTTSKRDNPFTIHVTESTSEPAPAPSGSPSSDPPAAENPPSSGGCSTSGEPMPSSLVPLTLLVLALVACKQKPAPEDQGEAKKVAPARIVSVGSANTETVFALGKGADVVAVDTSSLYPAEAPKLPQVGYQRALSAEGVLSVHPTLVLLPIEGGPPEVVAQLESAGLRIETVDVPGTEAGTHERIEKIAALLGVDGATLAKKVDAEVAAATDEAKQQKDEPKVLVLYARGPGTVQAFGQKTPADRLLALAHAKNAAQGFEGNKPISAEAVVGWAPDVIVLPARGLESMGGAKGVLSQPGIAETPAGKQGRVVPVDDLLLLGFGPRLGEAVRTLSRAVHAAP